MGPCYLPSGLGVTQELLQQGLQEIAGSHGITSAVGNVFSGDDSALLLSNLQREKEETSD